MAQWLYFYILLSLLYVANGVGGPYPPSFDCPMRQLGLEFAQNIQPWLTKTSLQQIADALNGCPEATNSSCVNVNNLPFKAPNDKVYPFKHVNGIYTIYVSPNNGIDSIHNNDINHPFKSLEFAINYIRSKSFDKNEWKQIILRNGTYYLSDTIYFTSSDSNLILTNYNNEKVIVSGSVPLTDLSWKIYKQNIYFTTIDLTKNNITNIPGLRVNNTRAIRARYPNANPEEGFGSKLKAQSWIPPVSTHPQPDILVYPDEPFRNITAEGYFQHYNLGIGGVCNNFVPPAGYWCSTKTQGGGASTYRIPTGLIYQSNSLPNGPYANADGGVIQTWRPGHWSSWMFEFDAAGYNSKDRSIKFTKGGFQGARGNNNGDEYYVENVFEELDSENEYFYNESTKTLYYYNNYSEANADLSNLMFEATKLKVLMNYTGSMSKPVQNIIIDGVTMQDSAYTYMDPHCMPSGGDWALQRTGAIYLDGTENVTISNNLFQRLDGIVISLNRYNRNITIYRNEFVWIGSTCIASMGDTEGISFPENDYKTEMGFDGTNGNQPRYLNISYNLAHEIGIWEKQSSFYFQSKSCQNHVQNNIFYNGPRAGININDGFGGNSKLYKNFLFNTCRESGDHGPINTWDRQVYVTSVNDGITSSFVKAYDHIYQNFLIANYDGLWAVDNDDGSSYYLIYNNFEVYANGGLKNNFGGHNIKHYNNIFGYVQSFCLDANNGNDQQYPGYNDGFYNNICVINSKQVDSTWGTFACQTPQSAWPQLGNNTIYLRNESNVDKVGLCGLNEKAFQQKYNADLGTTILGPSQLNDSIVISQAKQMLFA